MLTLLNNINPSAIAVAFFAVRCPFGHGAEKLD